MELIVSCVEAHNFQKKKKEKTKHPDKKETLEQGFGIDPSSRNQFQVEVRRIQFVLWMVALSVSYIMKTALHQHTDKLLHSTC